MLYSHKGVENLCPLKNLHMDVHRSFTYICQHLKATFSRLVFNSSILEWRIPWTEEPGKLKSMGHEESDMTE